MYRSLRRWAPGAELWVLCLSAECHRLLLRLGEPGLHAVSMAEFELGDEALLAAKGNRSPVEYYFTCTPSLPLFVLRQRPGIDIVTYLDADLYFYSSVEPLFAELGSGAVSIIPHRYPAGFRDPGNGTYNVAWLSFRNDERGLAILKWWRERCLAWCYDRVEDGKFADQGYLNDWPERFDGVVVLQNKGANLAPWNIGNYLIGEADGQVSVDEDKLVFFHFHRLKRLSHRLFHIHLWIWPTATIIKHIYAPYIQAWLGEEKKIRKMGATAAGEGFARSGGEKTVIQKWRRWVATWREAVHDFFCGRCVIALGTRVWRPPFKD